MVAHVPQCPPLGGLMGMMLMKKTLFLMWQMTHCSVSFPARHD